MKTYMGRDPDKVKVLLRKGNWIEEVEVDKSEVSFVGRTSDAANLERSSWFYDNFGDRQMVFIKKRNKYGVMEEK